MKSWMSKLARHYDKVRARHPDDELLILFDIDGTILDMRCMVLYLLTKYDEEHGTSLFQRLDLADIDVHEDQVERLLEGLELPRPLCRKVLDWYQENRWSSAAILRAHCPFGGVMEVIRWFQIQPRTSVGLNSSRPESLRQDTLRSLNKLGKQYRVAFTDDLLFMKRGGSNQDVKKSKVVGFKHFQQAGNRIFAAVDNEPANLTALANADIDGEVLLLHADTIFETARSRLPAGSVRGAKFDITELISESSLPQKVQLVWHGLNDDANIRQFLASDVEWAEFDVRIDQGGRLIVRHDSFEETPLAAEDEFLYFDDVLQRFDAFHKSIKIDLKEGGEIIDRVIGLVGKTSLARDRLWFNGHIEILGEQGFKRLVAAFPDTIIQCRIDFLVPLIGILPEEGKRILDKLCGWGINRFSVPWGISGLTHIVDQTDRWGFDINIYNVPDLESFLKAVLQQPRSVTSDFNFPKWHYYGRGSGEDARRHEYEERV